MDAEKSKIKDRDRSFDHRINPERFQADFEELAEDVGDTAGETCNEGK